MFLPVAEHGILSGLRYKDFVDEKLAYFLPMVFAKLTHAGHLRSDTKK